MDPILELAKRYKLLVVEDACQAHGAEYFSKQENRWRKAGSMGHATAFSFYPGKNLGACGEAGALTTNDAALAQKVSMLRDHGQSRKYYHEMEGYNGRLDSIQAGILQVKLRHLPEWNQKRREIAARYNELLREATRRAHSALRAIVVPLRVSPLCRSDARTKRATRALDQIWHRNRHPLSCARPSPETISSRWASRMAISRCARK